MYYTVCSFLSLSHVFFFNHPPTTAIYTLSLHDALPISSPSAPSRSRSTRSNNSTLRPKTGRSCTGLRARAARSEEHTSELQSLRHLVCRLLLEKKKK